MTKPLYLAILALGAAIHPASAEQFSGWRDGSWIVQQGKDADSKGCSLAYGGRGFGIALNRFDASYPQHVELVIMGVEGTFEENREYAIDIAIEGSGMNTIHLPGLAKGLPHTTRFNRSSIFMSQSALTSNMVKAAAKNGKLTISFAGPEFSPMIVPLDAKTLEGVYRLNDCATEAAR